MKITQINAINYSQQKLSARKNNENEPPKTETQTQPSFKANLRVLSCAESVIKGDVKKFREACYLFAQKLQKETLQPFDTVILRKITGTPKQIQDGGGYWKSPGHWENRGGYGGNHFVPDKIKYGQYGELERNADPYYVATTSSENLEICINTSKTGFFYNDNHSADQISDDMINAYKHVRYLEHYAN